MGWNSVFFACLCFLLAACSAGPGLPAGNAFPAHVLEGEWGWEGSVDCVNGPLRFRFAEDAHRLHLSHLTETPDGVKRLPRIETSYTVLGGSPDRLRLQKDGDAAGEDGRPVTWELVLIENDAYCWRRSDWPRNGCTRAVRRCERT